MPDNKVTELDLIDTVLGTDLVMMIDDPTGVPSNKKASISQVLTNPVITGTVRVAGSVAIDDHLLIGTHATTIYPDVVLMEVGDWDGSNWIHTPDWAETGVAIWPSCTTNANDIEGYVVGVDIGMYARGTENISAVYGLYARASQGGMGTIDRAVGILGWVSKKAVSGPILKVACFEGGGLPHGDEWARGVVIDSSTGPAENTAYWTDQVAGPNNYAFRSVGDAQSVLGGPLAIGMTPAQTGVFRLPAESSEAQIKYRNIANDVDFNALTCWDDGGVKIGDAGYADVEELWFHDIGPGFVADFLDRVQFSDAYGNIASDVKLEFGGGLLADPGKPMIKRVGTDLHIKLADDSTYTGLYAVTAPAGTNTNQVATTAFVLANAGALPTDVLGKVLISQGAGVPVVYSPYPELIVGPGEAGELRFRHGVGQRIYTIGPHNPDYGILSFGRSDSDTKLTLGFFKMPAGDDRAVVGFGTDVPYSVLKFGVGGGSIIFCPAENGGSGLVQFGRRYSDSNPACGASVEFWTATGQGSNDPVMSVMKPGGASRKWWLTKSGIMWVTSDDGEGAQFFLKDETAPTNSQVARFKTQGGGASFELLNDIGAVNFSMGIYNGSLILRPPTGIPPQILLSHDTSDSDPSYPRIIGLSNAIEVRRYDNTGRVSLLCNGLTAQYGVSIPEGYVNCLGAVFNERAWYTPGEWAGTIHVFNDSPTNTPGAVVPNGGGTFHVMVRWTGTQWVVVG